MDGSTIVIPSATPPGGLAREDALFRIVYYGAALRAMTEHVSDKLISGPCVPMIEMLDESFDQMSKTRDSFGPEEFTLFVMSKMLGLCDDAQEARQFQLGAAQFMIKAADALPDEYRPLIDDARQMLRRDARLTLSQEGDAPPPTTPAPAPERTERKAEPARRGDADVKPATDAGAAASRVAAPTMSRRANAPAAADAAFQRARRSGAPRMHLAPARRGDAAFRTVERAVLVAAIAFFIGIALMYFTGSLEGHDMQSIAREPAIRP